MPTGLAIGTVALSPGAPKVVAAGGAAEADALAAADGADVVELRADLWDDPSPAALPGLLGRVRAGGRPVILTVRAAAEGGRPLDDALRGALYAAGLPHADAVDVEIASEALAGELVPRSRAAGRTVILSAHALDATPPAPALLSLVDRARALGAHVAKLATHARDLAALRTLLEVTLVAADPGIVTLALGPAGPLSRIVLPAAGSLLTYAHVGRPTAPSGQLALAELVPLLRRLLPA
jgi:3-dehydroquinate dehydratase-1